MKQMKLWVLGGLLAVAIAARAGIDTIERFGLSASALLAQTTGNTADMTVTLQGPASVQRPERDSMNIQYTMTVRNAGPVAATNVRVISPVPAGLLFQSVTGGQCQYIGGENVVSCTIGSLLNGGSSTVTLQYTVPNAPVPCTQTLTVQPTAMVWSDTIDAQAANNQSAIMTNLTCAGSVTSSASSTSSPTLQADLSVSVTAPSGLIQGQAISYNMQLSNNGPSPAPNIRASVLIPMGSRLDPARSDRRCMEQGDSIVCTTELIDIGQTSAFPLVFQTSTQTPCGTLSAAFNATTYVFDPVSSNNRQVVTTEIACPSSATSSVNSSTSASIDLELLASTVTGVYRGDSLRLWLIVRNNGSAAADGGVVRATIPANTTYDALGSDSRCRQNGSVVECVPGIIAPPAQQGMTSQQEMLIKFQTSSAIPCGSYLTYSATLVSDADPNLANNTTGTITTLVSCPASASSVQPAPSSASSTLSRPGTTAGSDLGLAASAPITVVKGQSFAHVFTVTNYGPETAKYNTLYDPMGNGFSFDPVGSDTRCKMEGGNVKCVPGEMPPGATETFIVNIRTSASQLCNSVTRINASVDTLKVMNSQVVSADPLQDNNRLGLDIKVVCGNSGVSSTPLPPVSSAFANSSRQSSSYGMSSVWSSAWSSARSSSSAVTAAGSADIFLSNIPQAYTVNCGETITFNAQIMNKGPSPAPNARLTLQLPAGTTFNAALSAPLCTLKDSVITCVVGTMAVNTLSNPFKIVLNSTTQTPRGTLSVPASVQSDVADPATSNNQATQYIQNSCPVVDVYLFTPGMSTAYNASVPQGGTVVHQMMAGNKGGGSTPANATDVKVTVPVPAGFTYNDGRSDARCDQSGTSVVCLLGTMAPGTNITMDMAFNVPANATCSTSSPYVSRPVVTTAIQETYLNDNSMTLNTYVQCPSTSTLTVTMPVVLETDSAAKNQKNVPLMRFYIQPDNTRDVLFTGVRFAAAAGSVENAQNYTLWIDMDYNGVTETQFKTGISPVNGTVTFANLPGGGQVIRAGKGMAMEVHADIAPTLVNTQLQLGFDTTGVNDYISAGASDGYIGRVATNGACPGGACHIYVTSAPQKSWYLTNQGNLFVTKDAEPVRSKQLLAGVLGDTALRLNFRSPNEDIEVTQLQISTWDSPGNSIDRLELYLPGIIAPFAVATAAGCGSQPVLTVNPANGKSIRTFCAAIQNRALTVHTYQDLDVSVRPFLKSEDNGAVSGESLTLWLPSRAGTVKARGIGSTNDLADNDGDGIAEGEVIVGSNAGGPGANVVSNPNQSVLSKFVLIYNSAPSPGKFIVSEGQEIGRFRFGTTNNSNTKNGLNRPVVADVIFSVFTSNVTIDPSSFKAANTADFTVKKDCAVVANPSPSETLVQCRGLMFEANPTLDISLLADVIGAGASNAWIQSSMQNFADVNALLFGPNPGQSRLLWKDTDAFSRDFLWVDTPEPVVFSTKYLR